MLKEYLIDEYKKFDILTQEEKDNLVHVNCCEKILFGANKVYSLNLDDNALKLARGFGGGLNIESTCGVITGAVMGLSSIFHSDSRYKEIVKDYIEIFKNHHGEIDCNILKELFRTEEFGCRSIILKGAEVFDEIVKKYETVIKK